MGFNSGFKGLNKLILNRLAKQSLPSYEPGSFVTVFTKVR